MANNTFFEIKEISILGLFHKYDVCIDLKQDCSILIGSNGIGKTTVLKIIDEFCRGNYLMVGKYIFDKLEIVNSQGDKYVFDHDDFLVPDEILYNAFLDAMKEKDRINQANDRLIKAMLRKLKERDLLGTFLMEQCYHKEMSNIIGDIINKYIDVSLAKKIDIRTTRTKDIVALADATIINSEYVKRYQQALYEDNSFYIDFVRGVHYPQGKCNRIMLFSETMSGIKGRSEDKNNEYIYLYCDADDLENNLQEFVKRLPGLEFGYEYNFRAGYSIDGEDICTDLPDIIMYDFMQELKEKSELNINPLITYSFYKHRKYEQIYLILLSYYKVYVKYLFMNEMDERIDELLEFFDNEVLFIHKNYVIPNIPVDSMFDIDLDKIINLIQVEREKNYVFYKQEYALLKTYKDFYVEVKEILLKIDDSDDDIWGFRDLLSQYIADKTICVTPRGLSIYEKSDKESAYEVVSRPQNVNEPVKERIVFGDIEKEIALEQLSSGEKKIILLLFLAVFTQHSILFMDEPELSISLLWQERLLLDLLDYGKFRSIIVATHSPYIARDEALSDYILYLP